MKSKKTFLYLGITTLSILLLIGCASSDSQKGDISIGESKTSTAMLENQGSTITNDSKYISESQAKKTALAHAELSEPDVKFVRVKLDHDNGKAVFEVEFYKDDTEYDYEIDAISGKILSFDNDVENHSIPAAQAEKSTENAAYISEAAAKKTALAHAELSEPDVKFVRVKLDHDNGKAVFEVEFYKDNTEYDYEIDAISGKILSYDVDND